MHDEAPLTRGFFVSCGRFVARSEGRELSIRLMLWRLEQAQKTPPERGSRADRLVCQPPISIVRVARWSNIQIVSPMDMKNNGMISASEMVCQRRACEKSSLNIRYS